MLMDIVCHPIAGVPYWTLAICRLAKVGRALGLQTASQPPCSIAAESSLRAKSPPQRKVLPHMYPHGL